VRRINFPMNVNSNCHVAMINMTLTMQVEKFQVQDLGSRTF